MRASPLLLLALSACAVVPHPAPVAATDVDPAALWSALDRADRDGALAVAEAIGWRAAHSIEGERLRQRLLVERGQRGAAVASVRHWQAEDPGNPDLLYLEARLLQDPARQRRRFAELARRFPGHAWIRLGNASLAVDDGRLAEARRELAAAPRWPDAADFRVRVEARLLAALGRPAEALKVLEPLAFGGDGDALRDFAEIAVRAGSPEEALRAAAESRLRRLPAGADLAQRIDAAVGRLHAEMAAGRLEGLEAAVAFLDRSCARAGAPGGWSEHARFAVPLVGGMLRAEAASGEPVPSWAAAGRRLLLGELLGHGLEVLLLQDARSRVLDLPSLGSAEVVLAARAASNQPDSTIVGAAVLAGFYVRADLAAVSAAAIEGAVERVDPEGPWIFPQGEDPPGGVLPEDWDLALRLWAARLAGASTNARRETLHATWLHEAGHLPETLPWFTGRRAPVADLPRFLRSLLRYGDPVAWMEYRAEARALAAAADPRWLLADVVAMARQPRGRYPQAYRRLLRDLLDVARKEGLPPLARWHELAPARIRALATEVLRRRGLQPLPPPDVALLERAFEDLLAELPATVEPAEPLIPRL